MGEAGRDLAVKLATWRESSPAWWYSRQRCQASRATSHASEQQGHVAALLCYAQAGWVARLREDAAAWYCASASPLENRAAAASPAASPCSNALWRSPASSAGGRCASDGKRGGAGEVLGQQRDRPFAAIARSPFDERADLGVLARADDLRQHLIGDVADQGVREHELSLVRRAAIVAEHDQVPLLQSGDGAGEVRSRLGAHARERVERKATADDRCVAEQLTLDGSERVESGGEQPLHRVGQLGRDAGALLGDPLDQRFGEQRVAARTLGQPVGQLRRTAAPRASRSISRRVSRSSSRSSRMLVVAFLMLAQSGLLSSRSSRPRHSCMTGARSHCARYSISSSVPSSAQCRSSHTITSTRSRARASNAASTAPKKPSRALT